MRKRKSSDQIQARSNWRQHGMCKRNSPDTKVSTGCVRETTDIKKKKKKKKHTSAWDV